MKKFIKTLLCFILINIYICVLHFWALLGVAFNDSGEAINNFLFLLPILSFFCIPMSIASIYLIKKFSKKKDISKKLLYILQTLIILFWVVFYVYNYMPNSFIRKTFDNIEINKEINEQNKINIQAKSELDTNNYSQIEHISNNSQEINIYVKNDKSIVILEYKKNNKSNYCISNIELLTGILSDYRIQYTKLNSNYTTIMDHANNLFLSFEDNEFLKISFMNLYLFSDEHVSFGYTYFKMLNENVFSNQSNYTPNNIKHLEIEKNNNVISISQDSLKYVKIQSDTDRINYSWVINKDGEQILSRGILANELYLNFEDLDPKFYAEKGVYEIYLSTYFDSDLYDSGYIKSSNSISWSNE